jgi:hypothetical protein
MYSSGQVDRGSNQGLQCVHEIWGNCASFEGVFSGEPTYAENVWFGVLAPVAEWRKIL